MNINIFDTHCHLQDERITFDIDNIIQRAYRVNVKKFICCGTEPNDWEDVLNISKKFNTVLPAFGVHPWYIDNIPSDWFEKLKNYLTLTPSIVGEIGLDHAIKNRQDKLQEYIFTKQLELALELKLPVNIHCRRAWESLVNILSKYKKNYGIIIHSFSGSAEMVPILTNLGIYFSFSGNITKSGNTKAIKALQAVPLNRLLIETDTPDIMPVINGVLDKTKLNEPANIVYVIQSISNILNKTYEEISEITWNNTVNLLNSLI